MTLACVAAVALTLAALAFPALRARLGLNPATPPGYKVGDRIDLPSDLYNASSLTLFVFVRGNCPSCERSRPMFKDIADQVRGTSARMVIVVSRVRAEHDSEYASAVGLPPSAVAAVDFDTIQLRAVPTMVLVNRSGAVRYALQGAPTDGQRDELLQLVRAGAREN